MAFAILEACQTVVAGGKLPTPAAKPPSKRPSAKGHSSKASSVSEATLTSSIKRDPVMKALARSLPRNQAAGPSHQIQNQRQERRSLRGSPLLLRQGMVGVLHSRLRPLLLGPLLQVQVGATPPPRPLHRKGAVVVQSGNHLHLQPMHHHPLAMPSLPLQVPRHHLFHLGPRQRLRIALLLRLRWALLRPR